MARKAKSRTKRSDASYAARRRLVLETAARAFNKHGFYRTSLDDIAAELDVTKAALYYYFKSKDEILYECHALAIEQLIAEAPGDDSDLSGRDNIERFVRRYVPTMTQDFGRCLVLIGTQPLEPLSQRKSRAARRQINELMVGWIAQGRHDGSVASNDPETTAAFVFGALNWVAQWFDSNGRRSIEAVTEEAVTFVLRALNNVPTAQSTELTTPEPRRAAGS